MLIRWRNYLHGVSFKFYTDNSACKWYLQHPRLSDRLARGLDLFSSLDSSLYHRTGALNVVADALSRLPAEAPTSSRTLPDISEDISSTLAVCTICMDSHRCARIRQSAFNRENVISKLGRICTRDQDMMLAVKQPASPYHGVGVAQMRTRLHAAAMATYTIRSLHLDVHTLKAFQKDYRTDPVLKHVWNASRASTEYEVTRGLIYMKSNDKTRRVCVPSSNKLRLDVIHNAHDAAIMAHPGIRLTQLAAAQWYFW